MPVRTFTLQEANAILPKVEEGLAAAKKILDELRDVRDQLSDLRIVWGDQVERESCPDHAEYESYRERFVRLEEDLAREMTGVTQLGCEVKDPDAGLVDFYARRQGEVVYLCWRRGEADIRFWHSLAAGFAGRQPLNRF